MSWTDLLLSTPASDASSLSHELSVVSVSPWTYGDKEGVGAHSILSFPNAIDALINKLNNAPAVFAIAVSAANDSDLADQINTLVADFPLKELLHWQRHAESLANLETDKFLLVDQQSVINNAPINALPEVKKRMEKDIAKQALITASDLAASDPLATLTDFETAKIAHDDAVNLDLPDLAGGDGWRFYSDGDIAGDLKTGHPGAEYTLTCILAFVGSPADLAYLVEMMP